MSVALTGFEGWETQEQVDACMTEHGVSRDQINRWRREGLLTDVKQVFPNPFHGSTLHYPPRTCAQIAAAARLFKEKNRVGYVGRMLWWEGYEVDERHWRPDLIAQATWTDRVLNLVRRFTNRDSEVTRTLPERLATSNQSNIILSRIRGRLDQTQLEDVFHTINSVATGHFNGMESYESNSNGEDTGEAAVIDGFDLAASETHAILGHKLTLIDALPGVFNDIARAMSRHSLADIAKGPEEKILAARNDVKNALRIAPTLYEAMSWIYGSQAFGLRFAAWISKKAPLSLIGMMILGFAALRHTSDEYLSSREIESLADQAEEILRMSQQMQCLRKNDPRFATVFSPKRLRQGFMDRPSMSRLVREIEAARECDTHH